MAHGRCIGAISRVAAPGDLPRLHEGVADVAGDVAAEVQWQRPVHEAREQAAGKHGESELAAAEGCQIGGPQTRQSSRGCGGAARRLGPVK